jgi:hypothetical protein
MKLWQMILKADKKLDLANEATAKNWITAQPWHYANEPLSGVYALDCGLRPDWSDSIQAFRFYARIKRGAKASRPSKLNAKLAEHVMATHMHLVATRPTQRRWGRSALAYGGLWHIPTFIAQKPVPVRILATKQMWDGLPADTTWWWDGASLFWQAAFLSLFEESGPAVCEDCGRVLPSKTKRLGKPSRQKKCSSCRGRDHLAKIMKLSKKKRSEVWRKQHPNRYKQMENQ